MQATEIKALIDAARPAQKTWAKLSWSERSRILKPLEGYLAQNADTLADCIQKENGKTRLDALATELLPAAMATRYYRKQAGRFAKTRRIRGGNPLMFNKKSRLIYKPYGVVGIISPWNYPFAIPYSELLMALLAGNAVLLKVASNTLEVGRALEAVFKTTNIPEGLFTYVEIPGNEAGPAFIDGGVDKLFFTGSTAVGRELMALAAPRLLPLVLELGGADAAIVRADADLDRAVMGIVWAGFSNAGQSCAGVQRILVHREVYNIFLEKLCGALRSLKVGDSADWDCDMGPLINIDQKAAVRSQIEACLAKGATIAAQSEGGSMDGDSALFPAMVLTKLTTDMPIMQEEVFGPVVAVLPVADDKEALEIAHQTPYALSASVWSRNRKRAWALAERLNAGSVMINDHLMSHGLAETPWGGFGDSGLGRTHGEAGFKEMLRLQVLVEETLPQIKKNLWWQPYSKAIYDGLKAILNFLYAPSIGKRIRSIPRVLKLFFRYWEKH